MTALPPDPDPEDTPSLEPGGGVAPGATPPESAQTSGLSAPDPTPTHRFTPTAIASLVAIALFVLLFVVMGVLLVVGWF